MRSSDPRPAALLRYVGIDVGGSKVRALAADADSRVLAETTQPTERDVIGQLHRIVNDLGAGCVAGVGVGVPGAVDPRSGIVSKAPNVSALEGVSLAASLRASLGVPVAVENDLVAAAFAESRLGHGAGEFIAVIAAGTGIGLGLVRGVDLCRGAFGAAGEIADIPMAGGGMLEDLVSVAGLLEAYRRAGGDAEDGVGAVLASAERRASARTALDEYADGLAHAIRIVVAVIDPERVVLSGGLGTHSAVLSRLERRLDPVLQDRVGPSALGSDLPAHGAMLLALSAC